MAISRAGFTKARTKAEAEGNMAHMVTFRLIEGVYDHAKAQKSDDITVKKAKEMIRLQLKRHVIDLYDKYECWERAALALRGLETEEPEAIIEILLKDVYSCDRKLDKKATAVRSN